MLRGSQIIQDVHQYIGRPVFVSAHAHQGSGMKQCRGTLLRVESDTLVFKGEYRFVIDTVAYDVMLSPA